jgi:hypothetical protein
MTGRADGVDRSLESRQTPRRPDGVEVTTTAFDSRGRVTRLGGEPIALRLVLDHGAMAGLAFGSDSIWAVHGRSFPLVVSEPSG